MRKAKYLQDKNFKYSDDMENTDIKMKNKLDSTSANADSFTKKKF